MKNLQNTITLAPRGGIVETQQALGRLTPHREKLCRTPVNAMVGITEPETVIPAIPALCRLESLIPVYNDFMVGSEKVARYEVIGVAWIVATGVPLHFLYSSTGWEFITLLAPINESTWEHFKLAFWPGLVWAGIEWCGLREQRGALWTAKIAALTAMPVLIATIFYGYTAVLGTNYLPLDIATFIFAVAAGQWIGFRIWVSNARWGPAPWLIALLAAMFIAFSYRSPSFFLFEDPVAIPSEAPSNE